MFVTLRVAGFLSRDYNLDHPKGLGNAISRNISEITVLHHFMLTCSLGVGTEKDQRLNKLVEH